MTSVPARSAVGRLAPGLALLVLLGGCARPSSNRAIARITAESEIRAAQRERFEAMLHQNVTALDTLLDDGLTYVHTGRDLQTRSQFLNTIRKQQLVYESISPTEVKVRVYDGLALVTGRSQMQVRNSAGLNSFAVRFTEVYVRRDGHWLLTAWQTTRPRVGLKH